jgi:hypothetical protein
MRDAINFFTDAAVIVVNMGALLKQTPSLLEQRLLASLDGWVSSLGSVLARIKAPSVEVRNSMGEAYRAG